MSLTKYSGCAALLIFVAACQPNSSQPPIAEGPDATAVTGDLPVSHILRGEVALNADDEGLSVVNIKPILVAPTYQSQPTFAGQGRTQFYYVAGNDNGKTDLWSYDLASGDTRQITNTLEKSEYSPKPAPNDGVSFIQESEDGEMTRVHAFSEIGDAGSAVIETGPVGYYEWLQGGSTLAVFYRSEPPMLQLVDVASGKERDVFENVGRVLLSSPDGETLFATRAEEGDQYEIVAVDVARSATESLVELPPGAQDFFLIFDDAGLPATAYSSMGTQLMTYDFANDSVWHAAADIGDLGYGSITRIAVASASDSGTRPIVFVVHPKDE